MGARESGAEGGASVYTDPEKAEKFARETGIDALACAFGTAHGLYVKRQSMFLHGLKRLKTRLTSRL